MAIRFLGCALLLVALAGFKDQIAPRAGSSAPESRRVEPRWEYKVARLDSNQCSLETDISPGLNASGQDGWELINYERFVPPPQFPKEAEGSLLMRPAATGVGQAVSPQTADSFQGEISMSIAPPPPTPSGGCRLIFKRQLPPPRQ